MLEEQTQSYDYVIVEEASQAYLTTIAAACKVGKKVIVVGDPKQILPMVSNKNYKVFPNIDALINGMNTISQIKEFSFNRKIETRRLTERSTNYTNLFYNNTIQSKSLFDNINADISCLDKLKEITHPKGGPVLVEFPNNERDVLNQMMVFLVMALNELKILKGNDIAVLTPYIETLTYFQQNLKTKTKSRNYLIESVDRVQGLDVDYCFYVIPKSSSFSFNLNRFNVATSRAKKCTFILVQKDFDHFVNLHHEVSDFLIKLRDEFSFTVNSNTDEITNLKKNKDEIKEGNGNDEFVFDKNLSNDDHSIKKKYSSERSNNKISLKVVDTIDLSKFKRPQKEIKKNKKNIYIIDTNVFIDYPQIISKIGKEFLVILSAKVIDELDNLKTKLDVEGQKKVQRALKSINKNLDTRELKMEMSDLSLIPQDFNKKSPDNQILSVALKFKSENPILLTSDNGLQVKAKGMNITTIGLNEFLKQNTYY